MYWHSYTNGFLWHGDSLVSAVHPPLCQQYEVEDGLFRDFAAINEGHDGVLEFANRYGCLYRIASQAENIDGDLVRAELLSDWVTEIGMMRRAVELWDLVKKKRAQKLRELIRWETDTRVVYVPSAGESYVIADERRPKLLAEFPKKQLVPPARFLVVEMINRRLAPPPFIGNSFVQINLRLSYSDPPTLTPVAETLLGELWLQFARSVSSGHEHRACPGCGAWFLAAPKRGPKQIYCSDKCRNRGFRKRHPK